MVIWAVVKLILWHSKILFVFKDKYLKEEELIFTDIHLWSSDLCFHQQAFLPGSWESKESLAVRSTKLTVTLIRPLWRWEFNYTTFTRSAAPPHSPEDLQKVVESGQASDKTLLLLNHGRCLSLKMQKRKQIPKFALTRTKALTRRLWFSSGIKILMSIYHCTLSFAFAISFHPILFPGHCAH